MAGWELLNGFSAITTDDTEPETESAPATGTTDDFEATQSDASETGTGPLEPLPAGWEEKTDSNGRKLYVNHVLRTTQWQRPVENPNTEVPTPDVETNSTLTQSNQSLPLPTGWEEKTDANGRSFFVNHIKRVTQWERPTISSESSSPTEDSRSRAAATYRQSRHISVEDTISLGPDENSPHAARRHNFAQQERRTQSTTSLTSLTSAGWELLDGFSAITTEDTEPETESAPATGTTDDFEATQSDASETGTGPLEPLPAGWEEKTDSNGRKFYVNHVLRTTQWQRPVENPNTEVPTPDVETNSTLTQSNQSLPLPNGWEEKTDANGRSFFVNHIKRVTQWERPTISSESSSPTEDSRSRAAATYRQRRHISVEDTISLGPDENSPHAARRHNFAQQERRTQSTTSLTSLTSEDIKDILEADERRSNHRKSTNYQEIKTDELPQIGARVTRGPDWQWDNQDGNGPGTVIGHASNAQQIWVEWDKTNLANIYNYHVSDGYGVLITDEPRLPESDGRLAVGCTVKPGKDWQQTTRNVNVTDRGVVIKTLSEGQVQVRWSNKERGDYSYGLNGRTEVEFSPPELPFPTESSVYSSRSHGAQEYVPRLQETAVAQSQAIKPSRNKNKTGVNKNKNVANKNKMVRR